MSVRADEGHGELGCAQPTKAVARRPKYAQVRQICGWSSAWVMDRYAHALDEHLRRDVTRVQAEIASAAWATMPVLLGDRLVERRPRAADAEVCS